MLLAIKCYGECHKMLFDILIPKRGLLSLHSDISIAYNLGPEDT